VTFVISLHKTAINKIIIGKKEIKMFLHRRTIYFIRMSSYLISTNVWLKLVTDHDWLNAKFSNFFSTLTQNVSIIINLEKFCFQVLTK
jgi:hypothetical protein